MRRKPNPERLAPDAPEATAAWFEKARPAREVLPELVGERAARELLKPRRGRPPVANPKEHVNIRLDADIVRTFRQGGSGWQTRINQALRAWLAERR